MLTTDIDSREDDEEKWVRTCQMRVMIGFLFSSFLGEV